MEKKRTMGFIEGAMIIAVANILVKIIGAVFKIPLDRFVLQTDGMALYNTSYTIYNLLFVISTAGLPTAISKLVAESDSRGDFVGSRKILHVSFWLLLCLGGAGTLILGLGARFFSGLVGYPDAYLTMVAMSPSLLFVSCMSALRGYFQGKHNMLPTAVSEVIEALAKLMIGLSLAYVLLPKGKPYAAAGAIFGVTVGSVLALLFLTLYYVKGRRKTAADQKTDMTNRRVLKDIVKIAVPITLGVSVFTLTSFIDTAMVTNQMKSYIYDSQAADSSVRANLTEEKEETFSAFSEAGDDREKVTEKKAAFIYGYLVRAITMFNMPAIVIAAIATSVVPAIATANAKQDKKKSRGYTKSALLIAVVLALPCAVGMSLLAKPIFTLVYGDGSFSVLLTVMGLAVAFLTLVQIANAVLQAWGKVWVPVINMLIGGAVKIGVNLLLVSRPAINIAGAPIGTLLCYITVVTLDLAAISRTIGVRLPLSELFVKPLLCTMLMGLVTFGSYRVFLPMLGYKAAMVGSILLSAIVYLLAVLFSKTLRREEILLLPKGERLASLMEQAHLLS